MTLHGLIAHFVCVFSVLSTSYLLFCAKNRHWICIFCVSFISFCFIFDMQDLCKITAAYHDLTFWKSHVL